MSALNRKLSRELRQNKALLAAITSIMALGVMAFIYMRSIYFNLSMTQQEYYAQCNMADFSIELKKVPLAELAPIEQLPGVVSIRPRIQFFITVDLPRSEGPLNGLVLSMPDDRTPIINEILLRRGSYFTPQRDNEVIVNDAFARKQGLHPGQSIHLLVNGRSQEFFIVGTAISSEFVYLVGPGSILPDPEHFGVFYIKQRYAEDIFDFAGAANQVLGRLSPQLRDQPDELLTRMETILDSYGVLSTTPRRDQASNRYLTNEIRGLGVFASIMPTIFLTVAAAVLNVLMSRIIEQQRTIIGTLKAIGYSDRQVFWHYLKFGGLIGVAGAVVGWLLGYYMGNLVTSLYQQFYEFPDLRNRIYPDVYLAGLAISLGCATLGTWHGARTALRLHPAQAMRPKPPATAHAILLERIRWFWRKLSFGWRMGLRNVFRNRLRTAVGLMAAALGAALMVTGFMMQEAMHFLVRFQYEQVNRSDIDLYFKDEQGFPAYTEALGLIGVDYAEPVLEVPCTFRHGHRHKKGAVVGLRRDARLTLPRLNDGSKVAIPVTGLLLTRKMASILAVEVGDTLRMQPIKGLRREVLVPVAEIIDSYVGLAVYAEFGYLNQLIGEESAVSSVQLQVDPRPEVRRALNRSLKEFASLQAVNARSDTVHNFRETLIKTQSIFINLLVLFAGVIFFGSVLNASMIGLAERQREVATLRVLGYGDWQIGALFLRESMLVTMTGTFVGLFLGYALGCYLGRVYDTELFRFPVVLTPGVLGWTLLLAVAFGLAAHAIVQRSIGHTNWLDAMKSAE